LLGDARMEYVAKRNVKHLCIAGNGVLCDSAPIVTSLWEAVFSVGSVSRLYHLDQRVNSALRIENSLCGAGV
jgi:hypothetical protein